MKLDLFDRSLTCAHRLPEDSLLLMFGDHGMTDAGEHGARLEANR